ncbi:SigE family RNA polymerase sigma factor [Micromonospora sp. NPDC049559]|uniref:SigE family RNA polymerase sigma factor n=1 Tax=Micromonospora sp. NPDC049559 TaxID=3155923 RepID=UPI003444D9A0
MTEEATASSSSDASYAAFVEDAWTRYLGLAILLGGDRHRAEELLQDCLVKLYVRWRQVTRRGDPHAYLRRMLVNGKVSWWRRTRRETLMAETPERPDPHAAPADVPQDLRAALLALSRQQRAVLVLRYYADLTEQQVATELGCSIGTVKTQHSRAMAKLRALLAHPHPPLAEVSR